VRQPINARILRNNLPDDVRYVAVTISGAHIGWILRASHILLYHGLSCRFVAGLPVNVSPARQFSSSTERRSCRSSSIARTIARQTSAPSVSPLSSSSSARADRRILAVPVDEQLGGAVEVEVRAQKALGLRSPAEAPASLCH